MKTNLRKLLALFLMTALLVQAVGCGGSHVSVRDDISLSSSEYDAPEEPGSPEDEIHEESAGKVDALIDSFAKEQTYIDAEPSKRAEQALEALSEMAKNNPDAGEAYVNGESIDYDEELQQITFEDAEGTLCIWPLEDEEETALDYVHTHGTATNFNSMLAANEEDVTNTFSDLLSEHTEINNPNTKILFVSAFCDKAADSISIMEDMKNSLNYSGINADITVITADLVKLRTALTEEKYSFISFLCHGFKTKVNGNYTCVIRAQGTCDEYANDSKLKADKKAKRVIKVLFIDEYYLTGDFFSHYYGKNKLDGSIIHLSSCSGMGYFSTVTGKGQDFYELSNGLLATGAKAVVGHINNVLLLYDVSEMYIEIAALSSGYNIFDSLFYAYHFWGTTDYAFYCQEFDSSGKGFAGYESGITATTEIRGNQKASFSGETDNITIKVPGEATKDSETVDYIHVAMSNCDVDFGDDDFYIEIPEFSEDLTLAITEDGFFYTDNAGNKYLEVIYSNARTEADIILYEPIGEFTIEASSGISNAITQVDLSAYVQYKDGTVEVIDLYNNHLNRGQTGVWYYLIGSVKDGKYYDISH